MNCEKQIVANTEHPKVGCRLLVNCSNLTKGGGVQVGSSIVRGFLKDGTLGYVYYVLSQEVYDNLDIESKANLEGKFEIIGFKGLSAKLNATRKITKLIYEQDVGTVFSVFGPSYLTLRKEFVHIVGFANSWLLPNSQLAFSQMKVTDKLRRLLKSLLYKIAFMVEADMLIVEAEHVKRGLENDWLLRSKRIEVIKNGCHEVFFKRENWQNIELAMDKSRHLYALSIGANYIHKNLSILIDAAEILDVSFGWSVKFIVTLPSDEFKNMIKIDPRYQKYFINVGPVLIAECPSLYKAADLVVFPSLLESSSATLYEAIQMEKPIVTTNLEHSKETCGDSAFYFEALSALDLAKKIMLTKSDDWSNSRNRRSLLAKKKEYRINNSRRVQAIIKLIYSN